MEEQAQFSFMEEGQKTICKFIESYKCSRVHKMTEEEKDKLCRTPEYGLCAVGVAFAWLINDLGEMAELKMMAELGIKHNFNQYLGFVRF